VSSRANARAKRIYAAASDDDGRRVLVDRLWPRGISKAAAGLDDWLRDIAPSDELRVWMHADPEHRYAEFAARYRDELAAPERHADLDALRGSARHGRVTLLTAAKDVAHSHVSVLLSELGAAPYGE
jgi:uncharacterized protein YeaO (DUF488 family)